MKGIPKLQTAWSPIVLKSDNTSVARPQIIKPIKYKLKPGEQFFTDRRTGKIAIMKSRNEQVSSDNRSLYQKKEDDKRAKLIKQKYEEDKNYEQGLTNLEAMGKVISPSTYMGPLFRDNDKSYLENMMSGEGTGDTQGNIALDLVTSGIIFNNPLTKLISNGKVVINPIRKQFFNRIVEITKDFNPIQDAIETGIIRATPKSVHEFPFFSYGRYSNSSFNIKSGNKVVIQGMQSKEIPFVSVNDFNDRIYARLARTPGESATPLYNGTPNTAPANAFWYYQRGKGLIGKHFWFKHNFNTSSISTPKPFQLQTNPHILVHLDYGDKGFNSGAYIKSKKMYPGKTKAEGQRDYIWFNQGKPYSAGISEKPFTRAFIIDKENVPSLIKVKDSSIPIGQWDGKKGFVLNSEYVSPGPININDGLLFELKNGKFILSN